MPEERSSVQKVSESGSQHVPNHIGSGEEKFQVIRTDKMSRLLWTKLLFKQVPKWLPAQNVYSVGRLAVSRRH